MTHPGAVAVAGPGGASAAAGTQIVQAGPAPPPIAHHRPPVPPAAGTPPSPPHADARVIPDRSPAAAPFTGFAGVAGPPLRMRPRVLHPGVWRPRLDVIHLVRRLGRRFPVVRSFTAAMSGAAVGALIAAVVPGIGVAAGAVLGAIGGVLVSRAIRPRHHYRPRVIHVHHHAPMPHHQPYAYRWGGW